MNMIIYKVTNLINNKIYVGQDKNNNPNYFGSGKTIKKAIKKYGKENFEKTIIEFCKTENELNEREIYWIDKLNSTNRKIGYNISKGGKEGDRKIGIEIAKNGIYNYWNKKYGKEEAERRKANANKKISSSLKKNPNKLIKLGRYNFWVEKYGENIADKKLKEWKEKISKFQKEKIKNGWKHSQETINIIKEKSTGRKHSEETKLKMRKQKPPGFGEKIGNLKRGKPNCGAYKLKIAILQYEKTGEFIKEWDSTKDAEDCLHISNIVLVLKGKRKSAGGYFWKYKKQTNKQTNKQL